MSGEVIALAVISIVTLLLLNYLFSLLHSVYSIEIFKCASTATCMLIANILMFVTLFLIVPSSYYLSYIHSPSDILKQDHSLRNTSTAFRVNP